MAKREAKAAAKEAREQKMRTEQAMQEFQQDLNEQNRKLQKQEAEDDLVARYKKPLIQAAFDLQSRLKNLMNPRFTKDFGRARTMGDARYMVVHSLFCFAEFISWLEIIRMEIGFIEQTKGAIYKSDEINELLDAIRYQLDGQSDVQTGPKEHFESVEERHGVDLKLFGQLLRGQQRAIGEAVVTDRPNDGHNMTNFMPMGLHTFTAKIYGVDVGSGPTAPGDDDVTVLFSASAGPPDLRALGVELDWGEKASAFQKVFEKLKDDVLRMLSAQDGDTFLPKHRYTMLAMLLIKLIDEIDTEKPAYLPRNFRFTYPMLASEEQLEYLFGTELILGARKGFMSPGLMSFQKYIEREASFLPKSVQGIARAGQGHGAPRTAKFRGLLKTWRAAREQHQSCADGDDAREEYGEKRKEAFHEIAKYMCENLMVETQDARDSLRALQDIQVENRWAREVAKFIDSNPKWVEKNLMQGDYAEQVDAVSGMLANRVVGSLRRMGSRRRLQSRVQAEGAEKGEELPEAYQDYVNYFKWKSAANSLVNYDSETLNKYWLRPAPESRWYRSISIAKRETLFMAVLESIEGTEGLVATKQKGVALLASIDAYENSLNVGETELANTRTSRLVYHSATLVRLQVEARNKRAALEVEGGEAIVPPYANPYPLSAPVAPAAVPVASVLVPGPGPGADPLLGQQPLLQQHSHGSGLSLDGETEILQAASPPEPPAGAPPAEAPLPEAPPPVGI